MEPTLTTQITARPNFDDDHIVMTVGVWDGDIYVASRVYVDKDMMMLLRDARNFVQFWTALYFDTGRESEIKVNDVGHKQLALRFGSREA